MPLDIYFHKPKMVAGSWVISDRNLLTDRSLPTPRIPTVPQAIDLFPVSEWELVNAWVTPAQYAVDAPPMTAIWVDAIFAAGTLAFIGAGHAPWVRMGEGTMLTNQFVTRRPRILPNEAGTYQLLWFLRPIFGHEPWIISLLDYTANVKTNWIVGPSQWQVVRVRQPLLPLPSYEYDAPIEFALPLSTYITARRIGHLRIGLDEMVANGFLGSSSNTGGRSQ